ncbi:hypothetical protein AMJ87_05235 [candidate division WOR_3 bacterium SM23_60]|uniref:DUF885 domain-containing protein n=1 Tax=candidate division WOR_3 bacterium SM23_60 TaxID=1703780 RepID=A0A0S8GKE2_UNCW3|nr:MAG: hypothetical protein AMJ87_05235 [candidate division WOR_3 bacterium SM23_60]
MTKAACKYILLFLVLTTSGYCAESQQRPHDIETLFRNFFVEYIELRPETGSAIGLPPSYGIKVRHDELDDESESGIMKVYTLYRKYYDWLGEYDRTRLSKSQRVAFDVLAWFLENELSGEKFGNHTYIIHPLFGFHNSFVALMTQHHQIRDNTDAEDYIARLNKVENKVLQLIQRLGVQKKNGIIPPLYIVENYLRSLNDFIQVPYEENVLYTSFLSRLRSQETISNGTKARLCGQVLDELKNSVYPAYAELIKEVSAVRQVADRKAGVWKLPDGNEYYRYCLRTHTTTDMAPEDIYDLGLKEVERIQLALIEQFKKLGITGSDRFVDLLNKYMTSTSNTENERYFFPATEEGRIQTLLVYQAIIDSMQTRLPLMFSKIPRAKVHVMRVPAFKEKTIGTYYQPPKLDGSEQGIFYANLSYQHRKSDMKALAYHEAVPGHHLQIALEQEQSEARIFKTLFFFTGYVEGWALYAEKLAEEKGFYDNTHSLIGYLRSELFRALRLVIDTGIHHKRWTREQAYTYLLDNLGWSDYSQIDRYIVWPGQACAYKVGELKILQLREHAKEILGDRFDIKEFHEAVLHYGSVPLDVLEQLVNDYIQY